MFNLEEKLSLMQELYGLGIEPSMMILEGQRWAKYCPNGLIIEGADPWYPLEQVLELLPESVFQGGNEFFLEMYKDTLGDKHEYSFHYKSGFDDKFQEWNRDSHLAALKLLLEVKKDE